MNIKLCKISIKDKPIIKQSLVDYLLELGTLLQENTPTEYKYLDSYFTEEKRNAYFIMLKNEIIGFVFANDYCIIKTNEIAIAEFYIKPDFRNQNFGFFAFNTLVKQYSLKWEVKTSIKNNKAVLFWKKAISRITQNEFIKKINGEEVVFSFEMN